MLNRGTCLVYPRGSGGEFIGCEINPIGKSWNYKCQRNKYFYTHRLINFIISSYPENIKVQLKETNDGYFSPEFTNKLVEHNNRIIKNDRLRICKQIYEKNFITTHRTFQLHNILPNMDWYVLYSDSIDYWFIWMICECIKHDENCDWVEYLLQDIMNVNHLIFKLFTSEYFHKYLWGRSHCDISRFEDFYLAENSTMTFITPRMLKIKNKDIIDNYADYTKRNIDLILNYFPNHKDILTKFFKDVND